MKSSRRRHPLRRVDGILLLDKPRGLSSNDALQRVRRIYRAEKAGHTGSLDPLATGLLPICLGEATKLCGILLEGDKVYQARVALGASTLSGDTETEIIARSDASGVDREAIEAVLPRFLGEIDQIPPMHSALKYQGQPLYELARAGVVVDRPPRRVSIHRLELLSLDVGVMELSVSCSKGTYIRTLAEDIAGALGQRAHLVGLHRLGAEPFYGQQALISFEQLDVAAEQGGEGLERFLLPAAQGLAHWRSWQAPDGAIEWMLKGGRIPSDPPMAPGRLAVLDQTGALRAMARVDEQGLIAPERCLLP